MGSISRYSALERFEKAFKETLISKLDYLKGFMVSNIDDVEVNYHVKSEIQLSNDEWFPVHFRWATVEEDYIGKEILEYGDVSFKDYLENNVLGQIVKDIDIGITDRDDEIYAILLLSNDATVEIPLGYHPENGEITGLAEYLLTKEQIDAFYKSEDDYFNNR